MWKIQSGEVCEFCMLLYYARKSVTTFRNVVTLFRASYKSIQKSQTSHDCIFHILRYLATKLHNFTKFMMLFPAVLMNFPNSKVCLIGEWSIVARIICNKSRLAALHAGIVLTPPLSQPAPGTQLQVREPGASSSYNFKLELERLVCKQTAFAA